MTIEQKAREIADQANLIWANACGGPDHAAIAARLGIIEGRRQAFEEASEIAADTGNFEVYSAIRALIEEQKV